ncbi:MAG: hypothetical protein V3V84_02465 [Candidatus Bathyarchaeia archaeon]
MSDRKRTPMPARAVRRFICENSGHIWRPEPNARAYIKQLGATYLTVKGYCRRCFKESEIDMKIIPVTSPDGMIRCNLSNATESTEVES